MALPRLTRWFSATVYVTILHFLVHVSIYLSLHFIDVNEWTSFFFSRRCRVPAEVSAGRVAVKIRPV